MRDLAIRNTHPTIKVIDKNATIAYDIDKKEVTLNESLISDEIKRLELKKAKVDKKQELINMFKVESEKPVLVSSINYNGGFDSALKLDGAKRLAELAGLNSVVFFDISDEPHTLTIPEANNVILAVSAKYQIDFTKLQEKKVLVESKIKVSTVKAVSW